MLAYAANRTGTARRMPSPPAMLVIAVAHIAAIALVMSAKMEVPVKKAPDRTEVTFVPIPPPPKPPEPRPQVQPQTQPSVVDRISAVVPIPQPDIPSLDTRPLPLPPFAADPVGPPVIPQPRADPIPAAPVRVGPRFATPDHALRPPYPRSRLDSGEEASLRLRLSIDPSGRVTAVEPIGRADPAFLEAARRHLIARWRYKPATEGGRPIASSTVITLRFELEG